MRPPIIHHPLRFVEASHSRSSGDDSIRLPSGPCELMSNPGKIGVGQVPMPGDVLLAHHGVRFLDELPEFRRHVLEVLRQPLENGLIYI
jgi:magnesium chelatase family protein